MRAVNLIPPDARRGDRVALRTGVVSYVVVGTLALALIGVVALALTSKQISDREDEVVALQAEEQQATARAAQLQPFIAFHDNQVNRENTVAGLAESRFDWDRVLNELARVIPSDVWLSQLSGTVNPSVSLDAGADIGLRDTVTGPALEMVGCATGQDAVAAFVADLEDIDGVTRVGVQSSERNESTAATAGAPTAPTGDSSQSGGGNAGECRTRAFISRFEIVVAFDAGPTPSASTTPPSISAVAPSTTAPAATSGTESAGTTPASATTGTGG
jgi:Tfp pilus assembly protein PilN